MSGDYWNRYCEWRDTQICLGCGAKSGTDVDGAQQRGEKNWVTEYLCSPCWSKGVRGEPKTMFDGYSGTVWRNT